jgi:cytochrome c oxidase subunit 2
MDWAKILGMPQNAVEHGARVDSMMGLIHVIMAVLFVGWGIFFVFCLFRFSAKRNPKADHHGVRNHLSSWLEGGIALVEALILVALAFPIWSDLKAEAPTEQEADVVVAVIAQQFAWNVHYPGADGQFGRRDITLVDDENVWGLDRSDPKAADDVTTINQLTLPVNKRTLIKLTSQDVIHSLALQEMRVKQDAIPGMEIPVYFRPVKTGDFEIACAQLCGLGHYRMRGFLNIKSDAEYATWYAEQLAEAAGTIETEEAPAGEGEATTPDAGHGTGSGEAAPQEAGSSAGHG